MKKILIYIILCMGLNTVAQAQEKEALKKIESARIALISERLALTPEQAEKFWPVYREYTQKRQALRQELQQARRGIDGHEMTEEESKALLEVGLDVKERELHLDKEYSERLLTVISSKQLMALRIAEEDFRKMLIKQLERREQGMEKREKNNERMKYRREGNPF
ncbi:hypothetical protein QWY31_05050 [Cytophagales bacterium LB-30]|uniref:Periplasmic heavy metal sensor n=1 Tax=Shiella aurantiaca TaxID=3058365 RepID=A0ABT8F326_9BACT|nr:hypothetical protein [Shiella aurantiaca]MDN4164857.1 hypothetical protein [Shiella aurantiaca]